MALPRHNPLLRSIYILTVIAMFGLFFSYLLPGAYDREPGAASEQQTEPTPPAVNPSTASEETENAEPTVTHVVGPTRTLDLGGDIEDQMRTLWEVFTDTDWSVWSHPRDPYQIVAVYHGFDFQRQRVEVTIGYASEPGAEVPEPLETVTIGPVERRKFSDRYVLELWDRSTIDNKALRYEGDYEIYRVDTLGNVLEQTAYIALVGGSDERQ